MPVTMKITQRSRGEIAAVMRPGVEAYFDPRMKQALANAKAMAPVDRQGGGGRLRASLRLYSRDAGGRFATQSPTSTVIAAYELVAEAPHAAYVVRGTRPHIIRAKGPYSLHNRKTGQFFGPVVRHPGTKPNDFISRALKQAGIG